MPQHHASTGIDLILVNDRRDEKANTSALPGRWDEPVVSTVNTVGIQSKSFRGALGGAEHFIAIAADGDGDLAAQIAQIEQRYADAHARARACPTTTRRLPAHLHQRCDESGGARSRPARWSARTPDNPVAVSLIQQPPLPGAKIALLAYHITDGAAGQQSGAWRRTIFWSRRDGRRHLWTTGLCAGETGADASPSVQTRALFGDLVGTLTGRRRNAARQLRAHLDLPEGCRRLLSGHGRQPRRALRRTGPDRRHPLHRQHRHRGRLRASLRPGCDGCLFQSRSRAASRSPISTISRGCARPGTTTSISSAAPASPMPTARIISSRARPASTRAAQVVHLGDVLRQLDYAMDNVEALLALGRGAASPISRI